MEGFAKDLIVRKRETAIDEKNRIILGASTYAEKGDKLAMLLSKDKRKKAQQKQIEKPKVKILNQPSTNVNSQNSNKGFTNIIILCLIASFVCGALFMVIYMLFGR